MLFNKSSKPQNRIESLIGAGTIVSGDIQFSGGLRIDGEVKGNVSAVEGQHCTLVVSEHASIEGRIVVAHVIINGTVLGPVSATEFLELQPRAKVTGDVEYHSIEMHLGAVVQGRLMHRGVAEGTELELAVSN